MLGNWNSNITIFDTMYVKLQKGTIHSTRLPKLKQFRGWITVSQTPKISLRLLSEPLRRSVSALHEPNGREAG